MAQSIFERYGGFSAVSKIVSSFYDRVLDSDNLAPYFEGTDMRRQIDHQSKFISSLMGGPASYSNDQLERSHQRLNINDKDFNEVVQVLTETFEDAGLDASDVSTIIRDINSRRSIIVTK
jgi:hemoglobin